MLFLCGAYFIINDSVKFIDWNIITMNGRSIIITFLFDWLSILFMAFVFIISSLVILYSDGYMFGDLSIIRFIALVLIFVVFITFMSCVRCGWCSARHHPHRTHDLHSGSQDHHPPKNSVQKTICCISTPNAPDDGRMYPKHVELRIHQ